MKLILDFDDTIFNTKAFKSHIFEVLETQGVSGADILYEKDREQGVLFSLVNFLKKLHNGDLYPSIMKDAKKYVNGGMLDILKSVSKDNCYIVTYGDDMFQRDKIRESGIESMVNKVFVVNGSKKKIVESLVNRFSSESVIFVDDKKKFLLDIDLDVHRNLQLFHFTYKKIDILKSEIQKVINN